MPDLTLEDIAKQSGVSRSTVSRVVNNDPNVSNSVRNKVQQVINSTGYHPHPAARSLASKRSSMIGLVLPLSVSSFFTDPYFPCLTQGIASACNHHNLTLALFIMETKEDEENIFPRVTRKGLLDGIIVQTALKSDKLIDRLLRSDLPVMVAGRPFMSKGVSYIDVDNVQAGYQAVNYLISQGYQRIGTIAGPYSTTAGLDRRDGYLKAIREQGWVVDEKLIVEGDFTEKSGYVAMQELLHMQPDAVFAASDTMAIGAIRAVREAGLSVPEDIAFVGFDDVPIASRFEYKLTTVRQPINQFGIKAVDTLIDLIENGNRPSRRVIMDTELVIRESCGVSRNRATEENF